MALRVAILGVLAVVVFCALFFRLWALQVISGERYLENANNNQIRSFGVIAPRGSIVDRDGDVLVSNKAGTLVQIWPAALENIPAQQQERMLRRLSKLLGLKVAAVRDQVEERLEDDPLTPVTIDTTVDERKTAYLMEHQGEFPGVQISETYLRNYDQGVLASQILGYVSEIGPEQLEAKADQGYRAGDRIGQTGIEAAYDTYLRGVRGEGRVLVDALGRITSEREFSQMPEAGDNIRLTIDADLQRTAEDALAYGVRLAHDQGEWAANGGALVAMDVNSGEILALASNPTFDPDVYVGRVEEKDLQRLASKNANLPTMNRAVAGAYPPGSTFKPFVALAAMESGLLRSDEVIQCTGEEVIDGQTFSNWDPYKNEPMTVSTALANSCDTFFYNVGAALLPAKGLTAPALVAEHGVRERNRYRRRTGGLGARADARLAPADVQDGDRQALDERRLRPARHRPGRPPRQPAADDPGVLDDRQRRQARRAAPRQERRGAACGGRAARRAAAVHAEARA